MSQGSDKLIRSDQSIGDQNDACTINGYSADSCAASTIPSNILNG